MKYLIITLLISATTLLSQSYPIKGEDFIVKYNLSEKNVFKKASELSLVYTFDFWGNIPSFENKPEELFQNVLNPIPGRKKVVAMKMDGDIYTAKISIPDSVALLSYYVTDGINNEYNNNATYTEYIHDKNGKAVKGAKFRKIEFMVMGNEPIDNQIDLLNEELKEYPDYHINRLVLWQKIFAKQITMQNLTTEKEKAVEYFENLINNDKEDWELYDRYLSVLQNYQQKLYGFLIPEFDKIGKTVIDLAKMVPADKRSSRMQQLVDGEKRQKESEELKSNIIGKQAFDFEFTTIDGKKGKLSDYRDKIVLLDFWGTWCGPCVGEIPNLVKAYNEFRNKGFEIISISSDGFSDRLSKEEFIQFTKNNKMEWSQILDSKDKKLHNLYKISHWPTLYLVGKDGKVIRNEETLRGETLIKTLEEILK